MIRSPATSISLSDKDISFHLQQIDIYHGLLKQGFKKHDILRYFDEHRAATQGQDKDLKSPLGDSDHSCVGLAIRGRRSPGRVVSAISPELEHSKELQKSADSTVHALAENISSTSQPAHQGQQIEEANSPDSGVNPPIHRHAPRQSSLLRFAKAASPNSDSTDDTQSVNTFTKTNRLYRRRTESNPHNESDMFDVERHFSDIRLNSPISEVIPQMVNLEIGSSSRLRADADVFTPLTLPAPFSATTRRSSAHAVPSVTGDDPDSGLQNPPSSLSRVRHGSSSPHANNFTMTSRASEHVRYNSRVESRSSPPSPVSSPEIHSSPSLSHLPITPTLIRGAVRDARTEPRNHYQYLDGGSFSVYNDSLPASTQPQTPADMTRRFIIPEHEAAYTAPPGRIRYGSVPAAARMGPEIGEQSPTVRAIGMRERRAREMVRGVRAERLRLEHIRGRDRDSVAQGFDGDDGPDGPGPAIWTDLWRDELEGDRVGDENFDAELNVGGGAGVRIDGMRVVSGNAQRLLDGRGPD